MNIRYMNMKDIRIFSQLCIATQTRDGDLDIFFSHEDSFRPPSLPCVIKGWRGGWSYSLQ